MAKYTYLPTYLPNDTFLPPQTPTVEAVKIDFDCPITNLIDKANNIIKMLPKNEKQYLDKYRIHLSEQLSKLFPEVEHGGGGGYLCQEDNKKKMSYLSQS